jgi:tetratricopeptide (TPR) repeat protein
MPHVRLGILSLAVTVVLGTPTTSTAQDTWFEVKSPHFTVVSNAGEGSARNVAWQFEQIRAAIRAGWPWARVQLDRPVLVIAVKDETSMKAMAPRYWEQGNTRPTSVFVESQDRYYIALRSDVRGSDQANLNPYFNSYWSYSSIALDAAYDRELPLWLKMGLAGVLSNSIVQESEIRFGLPIPWYLKSLQQEARLRLADLVSMDSESQYFKDGTTRERFDAQSWGLVHYLLFGRPDGLSGKFNQLVKLLLDGRTSAAALQEVYGDLNPLEQAYLQHSRKQIFQFARLNVETSVVAKSFALRRLLLPESASARAGFHQAMNRPVEARVLIAEARKTEAPVPTSYEVEGLLLDREGQQSEAQTAFERAESLNSENFYAYYRLATLMWPPNETTAAEVEKRLRKAVALNDMHPSALATLADVVAFQRRNAEALQLARKAVSLAPGAVTPRLSLARVVWNLGDREQARTIAKNALGVARNDQERRLVQELTGFFDSAQ